MDAGSHEFNVTVLPVDDAPTITTEDVATALEDEFYVVYYDAKDPEADPINWTMTSNAGPWLTLGPTGRLSGTPANEDVGFYSVNITASDGQMSTTRVFVLRVENVNDPPVLMTPGHIAIRPGDNMEAYLSATDPDPVSRTNLKFALVSGPEDMNVDPLTGKVTWRPGKDDVGTRTISVMVSDGEAVTAGSFEITVKEAKGSGTDIASSGDIQPVLWLLLALLVAMIAVLAERLVPRDKGPREPK